MVKFFLLPFSIFISICSSFSIANAARWGVSIGSATWQEKIPVVFQGAEVRQKTSFTGTGFGASRLDELKKGWYWDSNLSLIVGLADVQRLEGAVTPRRNSSSFWLGNRFIKRLGPKVGLGPNVLVNARKIDGLNMAISSGLFIDFDYLILEKSLLTQSIGTVSDSGELGYFIRYSRYF